MSSLQLSRVPCGLEELGWQGPRRHWIEATSYDCVVAMHHVLLIAPPEV